MPLSWLRDYVDFDLSPEQLAERLTMVGMEVQSIERWGSDWQNVVVGELLSVAPHPRADRLSLTTVTLGDGSEPLEIICGATNIAVGQRVPVAVAGAVLPGGRRIDRTEKMGVTSNGMLCSGDELNLTGDADGILILPPDAPLGVPLEQLYGDIVLDVDVKPNRGDALSLVGLAREVAAIVRGEIRFPEVAPHESGPPTESLLAIEIRDPDLCRRFVGRWVSGVGVAPSPDRVQMRLRAAGVRPVSNVVDASNYVMLELGKPIHTYDAAGIAADDGHRRLIVRRAETGERIETLDHVERTLDADTLLISDSRGPVGIAGIMGDAASEVSDTTTDVIIESAIFDAIAIRQTGQRYGLRSEASLRFEKGVEGRLARLGADRTARLINEWAGGEVATGRVDTAPTEPQPARVAFRPARVNRLLGTALTDEEQRELLARVGIETTAAEQLAIQIASGAQPLSLDAAPGEALVAVVPTWRRDVAIEADVAEEVARVHGYDQIPSILPDTPMPPYRSQPLELRDMIRETLVGAGVTEVISHALVSPDLADAFRWESELPRIEGGSAAGGRPITVVNPLSTEHSVLRPGLIASLVEVVSTNIRHGTPDVAIFEIGKGYGYDAGAPDREIREWTRLAIAVTGNRSRVAWNEPAQVWELDDVKGLIELVGRRLGIEALDYQTVQGEPLLHPGRAASAEGRRDGKLVLAGWLGELHPGVAEEWDVRAARTIVAELDIAGLEGGAERAFRATAPPRHPPVERDLAVVVQEERPAGAVASAIRAAAGPRIASIVLFDVYRGAPLSADEKSLAFRLTFSTRDEPNAENDVDATIEAITARIAADVGGRIRT